MVDGIGGAAGFLQRGGQPGVQRRAVRAVTALLGPAQQQGAEQRVVARGAWRGARRAQEQAALAHLGDEPLGQLERRERDGVELEGQRGLLQARHELGWQAIEHLLGQEGERAPVGGRRAAVERRAAGQGGGGDAERPALGRLEHRVDLGGRRLDAAAGAQQLGALARVEDEVGRADHRQPSGRLEARRVDGQRRPRGDGDADRPVGGQHLGQQRAGGGGGARVLGVVDDERQRLDEQLGQRARDLLGQRVRVDALAGHDEALAEHVDRAGHRAAKRGEDARHQRAVIVALAAAHPRAGQPAALDGGLDRGRLPEARAGHHEQRSGADRVGQTPLEPRASDPGGRAWHGGSI